MTGTTGGTTPTVPDPVPGDPDSVRAAARRYVAGHEALDAASSAVGGVAAGLDGWRGEAAGRATEHLAAVRADLGRQQRSLERASQALTQYATELEELQTEARVAMAAVHQAQHAQQQARTAQLANPLDPMAGTTADIMAGGDGDPDTRYRNAMNRIDDLRARAREAANRCAMSVGSTVDPRLSRSSTARPGVADPTESGRLARAEPRTGIEAGRPGEMGHEPEQADETEQPGHIPDWVGAMGLGPAGRGLGSGRSGARDTWARAGTRQWGRPDDSTSRTTARPEPAPPGDDEHGPTVTITLWKAEHETFHGDETTRTWSGAHGSAVIRAWRGVRTERTTSADVSSDAEDGAGIGIQQRVTQTRGLGLSTESARHIGGVDVTDWTDVRLGTRTSLGGGERLGPDGMKLGADASVQAGIDVHDTEEVRAGGVSVESDQEVFAGGQADAGGGVEIGPHGLEAGGHVGGFVGVQETFGEQVAAGGIRAQTEASLWAGVGFHAEAHAGYHDGRFTLSWQLGGALGLGAKFGDSVTIDPVKVVEELGRWPGVLAAPLAPELAAVGYLADHAGDVEDVAEEGAHVAEKAADAAGDAASGAAHDVGHAVSGGWHEVKGWF